MKIVRLTSPNLNYFTILGSLMLYSLVYIRIYSNATAYPSYIRCILERVLINVGYMLCFAPVLMKMCRVYYIFHNPSPVKKAIKDWHLFLGTAALVAIIIVLLVIGIGTPMFRGVPKLKRDPERPEMATEDGIRVENFIYQCYGLSVSLAWVAIEYLYLVSLQVAAFVLAILTRKVKIKVLNDSKEMMIVVYSTSTIMLVVGVLTFAFDTRLILDQVIFCGLVMVATSVFLTLVYIPKMIDLYRDPRGEGVFGGAHDTTTHQAEVPASTNPTFLMHDKAGGM